MRRRAFVASLCGTAIIWPLTVSAQRRSDIPLVGALFPFASSSPEAVQFDVFREELGRLGWHDGRNVSFEIIWGGADAETLPTRARKLVGRAPDVILAPSIAADPARAATTTTPIVFVNVSVPLHDGVV